MGRHLDASTILLLYKSYVRSAVEYATPAWCITSSPPHKWQCLTYYKHKFAGVFRNLPTLQLTNMSPKITSIKVCFLDFLSYGHTCLCKIVLLKYIHVHPQCLSRFNISPQARILVNETRSSLTPMAVFHLPFSITELVTFGTVYQLLLPQFLLSLRSTDLDATPYTL